MMMNSNEMMKLVAEMRYSAEKVRSEQYRNGTYSRDGGNTAKYDFERYADILEKMAVELIKKEAVEAALAQLPISQTIIVKI
jgi:hypothetical protein